MLTERRARILQLIIREYVDSAVPVGSETLVRKHGLRVSPATIRHEMVSLEDEGYLMQPHTSAGRIPSDRGLPLLRGEPDGGGGAPGRIQRTIRHQFYQVGGSLEEWARLAAAVIARWAGNLALVTAPHAPRARLRWLELVEMRPGVVLLVVVLRDGRVRQQTVAVTGELSQEELTVIAQRLSGLLGGLRRPRPSGSRQPHALRGGGPPGRRAHPGDRGRLQLCAGLPGGPARHAQPAGVRTTRDHARLPGAPGRAEPAPPHPLPPGGARRRGRNHRPGEPPGHDAPVQPGGGPLRSAGRRGRRLGVLGPALACPTTAPRPSCATCGCC